jgi:hypothetical protein
MNVGRFCYIKINSEKHHLQTVNDLPVPPGEEFLDFFLLLDILKKI